MRMVHAVRRSTLAWPVALLLVLSGLALTPPAHADDPVAVDCARGTTISNGTVQLGVNCVGDLGTADDHGLGFVPNGAEAVSQGCACEGWGVADGAAGVAGWANQSSGDSDNLSLHSFSADDTSAVSVVDVGSTFQVTQDFHPSAATPNLYEVAVTIANVSDAAVDLRYRRVMDWDIEPTPFNEMVTLERGSSARIVSTSDNGFASSDPQSPGGKIDADGSFADSGPDDHGALFDFDFGQIEAGSSRSFKIFYGAADSEAHADAALNSVNAEAFSYGQPSSEGGADLGEPNTFVFGFKDIDGGSFFAPNTTQDVVKAFTDEEREIDVLKNDSDPNGDPIAITGNSAAEHGTATCTPSACRYLSDPGYEGPDQFTYQVSDGNGGVAGATVSLTVAKRPANRPPDAVDDDLGTAEDTAGTVAVLRNDSDPDEDDVLSVVGYTDGAHGTVACTDTTCTYEPDADTNGTDSFTYTVSDGHVTSTATVRVLVDAVNDAPVARDDAGPDGTGIVTDEDTSVPMLLTGNDTDADGDALTAVALRAPGHGSVSCTGGTCTYTPAANFNGRDSFTYRAFDGTAYSSPATVSLVVRPVDDAPAAVADTIGLDEDGTAYADLTGNDTDVDGDALSLAGTTAPRHGRVACGRTGCSYTPDADYNGPDSFTYTVTDGTLTATGGVTVTVRPVDDAPVAVADDASTDEDTAVDVQVTGNDTDVDDPVGSLTAVPVTGPAHGTVRCTGGSCRYVPAADFNGTDTFTYRASDGRLVSAPVTVTVSVRAVDDAPVVGDDRSTTVPGQPVEIDVLANDHDVDGDALRITDVSTPAHGSVACATTCTYTPDAGFAGADSFTYVADDGHGGRTTGTVTLSVRQPNRAPQAGPDDLSTPEDIPLTFSVVGNDNDPDAGDHLTVTGPTGSTLGGTVSCTAAGSCTYVPLRDVNGTDDFSYTLTDDDGAVTTGLVTIRVTPVNDAPVAGADRLTTDRDVPASVAVLANDADVDGDPLGVTVRTQPANGSVACTPAGVCTFTPATHWAGTTSYSYTVADGHGGVAIGTVSVTVNPTVTVADAPTIGTPKSGRFTVSRKKYNALVAWKAPTWTGATTLTGYKVSALRYSGSRVVSTKTFTASKTSKSLYLALSKGSYVFKVAAVNPMGTSAKSAASRKITVH